MKPATLKKVVGSPRRLAAATTLAAILAAGGLHHLLGRRSPYADATTCTVTRMNIGVSLVERGILVNRDSSPVEIQASGEIVDITRTGSPVKKGDIVVRVDNRRTQDNLDDLQREMRQVELEKQIFEAEYAQTEVSESNRLALLKEQLAFAILEEEVTRTGLTPEDRRLLDIQLELARLARQDAEDELEQQKRLLLKEFASPAMVERYERKAAAARAAVQEMELTIRLKTAGADPEKLVELKQRVDYLRQQLERGEKARERALELVQTRIRMNEVVMERKNYWIAIRKEELDRADVRAPVDGIMSIRFFKDWRSGGGWTEFKPGVSKWRGERVADIVNLGNMRVFLMIHEADINRVALDMPVRIRVAAYPSMQFQGRIVELGGIGRDRFEVAPLGFEPDKTGVTMFNASVSLDSPDIEFRPGMSAIVEIELEKPERRLVIPLGAVFGQGDDRWVLRKSRRGVQSIPVRGRPYTDRYFRVEEGMAEGVQGGLQGGLKEGDTLLILPLPPDDKPGDAT